jgi:hypothetical protein
MTGSVLDARVPLAESAQREGTPHVLPFTMQRQAQSEWCWAANSVSIAAFYDPKSPWTQCALVCDQLGQKDCCTDGSSAACNQAYYLSNALERVGHAGRNFADRPPLPAIAAEIDGGRPLGLCIDWTGGGGHFVTVDGCDEGAGMIDVQDSLFGHSYVPDETFPAQYQGGGTWSWTYLTCP